MTNEKFKQHVLKCAKMEDMDLLNNQLHAVLGLVGEAGEFADEVKKAWIYRGESLSDNYKLVEELGDVLWYVFLCAEVLGVSIENLQTTNVDKLKLKYPEDFKEDINV